MAHTNSWDESTPLSTEDASTADDYLRNHRLDLGERLEDMLYGFNASDNTGAENDYGVKSFRFYKQASDPTAATDYAHVYVKLVDGVPELFYQDDENTTKQLTVGGALNIVSAELLGKLANDTYFTGIDAAGTGTVDLIKAGTNDLPTLPDSAEMASNAAPVEDEAIVNKKYVDDQMQSLQAIGTSDINVTTTEADMTDMSQEITTLGGNVLILFSTSIKADNTRNSIVRIRRDTTDLLSTKVVTSTNYRNISMSFLDTSLSAGTYTYKIRWVTDTAGTTYQNADTDSLDRVMQVIEMPA